jgi:hypothetical protein
MNLFNRIFTIVTILVLTLLGLAALIIPLNLLSLLNGVLNALATMQLGFRVVFALAVLIIAAFLLWLEFRRPGAQTVEVTRASGGSIRITTTDIEDRIKQQIDALSGVIGTRVRVSERNNAVEARLDVQAAPGTDLIAKGEEIAANTREIVQGQLGLKVYGKPQITITAVKTKQVRQTPTPTRTQTLTETPTQPSDDGAPDGAGDTTTTANKA